MWKHQILADMYSLHENTNYAEIFPNWQSKLSKLIKLLENSVGIYVGDVLPIEEASHALIGEEMKRSHFNLPFKITLFMYNYDLRCATLAIEYKYNKIIFFAGFAFCKDHNMWVIDDCFSYFDMKSEEWNIFEYIANIETFKKFVSLDTVEAQARSRTSHAVFIMDVLNCKNVQLSPVEPPKRLNRARAKKGKGPLYRYHVLTVDLNKAQKVAGSTSQGQFGIMPAHLCRGHFKEYTEDKPLFGRVTGRFWWQPYARGKAKNGVVMKDYDVKKA